MMSEDFVILFFVVPLVFSFFPLIEKTIPKFKVSKAASVISFIVLFILLGLYAGPVFRGESFEHVIGGWTIIVGISQKLDGIAWIGLALMYLVSFPAMLYAFSQRGFDSTFYFFFLVLHSGMAGMVLAADLFNLFVCLEITGICAYVLIAYTKKKKAVFASFKYLMLSSLGISLFLVGVFVFYKKTGSLYFMDIAAFFRPGMFHTPEIAFATAALIAGIGVRTAFIPYTWLPDAHAFAPHPVSAVLSGVVIKTSFIAVWRLTDILGLFEVRLFLLWMGSAIALIGVLRALTQNDFKVLLAWHSVSQMGYIFAGFGAGSDLAVTGSMYHAVSHAFFKSLLFLSVSVVILFTGERSLKKITGTGAKLPLAAILFAVGALSIAGLPPFTGYVSKKLILSGLKDYPAAYWMLFAASIGTVASFTKLSMIFRGKLSDGLASGEITLEKRGFSFGYAGMAMLAGFCIASGIFGTLFSQKIAFLISGVELDPSAINLWKDKNEYIKTVIVFLSGILVYLAVMSSTGKRIQEYARKIELSFDSQLVLLFCGFLTIAAFIHFY